MKAQKMLTINSFFHCAFVRRMLWASHSLPPASGASLTSHGPPSSPLITTTHSYCFASGAFGTIDTISSSVLILHPYVACYSLYRGRNLMD